MAKNSPSDELIVTQATRRSLISEFLTQHEGEHSVAAIAEATSMKPAAVGLTLKTMAENGLVSQPRREKGQNYYHEGASEPSAKRTYTKRPKIAGSVATTSVKDVELVVGGTLIVIGRNAATGRIRITLEDLS